MSWTWGKLSGSAGQVLTRDEEVAVAKAVASLPAFPDNPLNGCQSRAHVVFTAIDELSHHKAYKVWLFAAPLISPGLDGSIGYKTSKWNYHVAAAYAKADVGAVVIDKLVSSEPLRIQDWLSRFTLEGLTVVVPVAGTQYMYNTTTVAEVGQKDGEPLGPTFMSRNVFNGTFFLYERASAASHDGAKALAADALAVAFGQGKFGACRWKSHEREAKSLINDVSPFIPGIPTFEESVRADDACSELRKRTPTATCPVISVPTRSAPPSGCEDALALFRTSTEVWTSHGL